MKYDPDKHHRRSIRLQGYDYSAPGAYFITLCAYQRQCVFGDVVDGVMELNALGKIVHSYWLKLPKYHPQLQLDEFVVMPNHLHGILIITDPHVGAGFDINQTHLTDHQSAKPALTPQTSPSHLCLNAIDSPIDAATPMGDRGMNSDPTKARAGFGVRLTSGIDSPIDGATPMTDRGMKPDPAKARAGFGVRLTSGIDSFSAKPAPTINDIMDVKKKHTISEIVWGFKTFSSRQINQFRKTPGTPIWQRNYYEHIIRNQDALFAIRQYIHNNPLSWRQDQFHPQNSSKW